MGQVQDDIAGEVTKALGASIEARPGHDESQWPLLANFFLEDFDTELEKSGRKLV